MAIRFSSAGGRGRKRCADAETFLKRPRPDQIVSIAHVSEAPYGRVFVWYCGDSAAQGAAGGRASA